MPASIFSERTGGKTEAVPCRRKGGGDANTLTDRYAAKLCGPAPLMGRLKELWSYLHASFESTDTGLRQIQRAPDLPFLLSAIESLVAENRQ